MDAFVTDYSSAAFDASETDMPVFIYADDIEKYMNDRGRLLRRRRLDKVYLFGGGNNAYGVIQYIGKENIIAVVDNEPKKQGCKIMSVPIISYEDFLKEYTEERIIITTLMYSEIVKQLSANGIDNYEIAPFVVAGMPRPEQLYDMLQEQFKKKIIIYGYNIISECFCEYLKKRQKDIVDAIIVETMQERTKAEKNGYRIIDNEKVCKDDIIISFSEQKKEICNGARIISVYDIWYSYDERYSLKQYHNKYKGKTCFIIGNGPSLKYDDLNKIARNNICSFGLNLIYGIYDVVLWRPTYHIITEYNIYRTYYDEISKLKRDSLFIKDFLCDEEHLLDVNYYKGNLTRCYYENQRFSENIAKVVYSGCSVMFDAMQIAIYMGFKNIYLLGADFTVNGDATSKGNHVYDDVKKDKRTVAGRSYLDATLVAFEIARKYAESKGVHICNATRGGNLEVFDRVNFDSLFDE